MNCNRISWPNLSALRVLEFNNMITGPYYYRERKFQTLLTQLSLESLTINFLFCSDRDCAAIGNHVMSTTSLKELCISSHWSRNRMEYITAALANNQSLPLERLVFKYAGTFTATAGDSLAQFITNTTTLKSISIKACTFSAHALLVLARALHHNSILETKNVDEFWLTVNGDIDAKGLAQLQVEYPDLVKHVVDLTNNSGSCAGAVALAQGLHHNSTPTELKMSNNSISDAGAVAVAQALHHNFTSTGLYLSNNGISDAGAVALAQALHHNSTLTELYLPTNSISDAGAVALAEALHHNSTLTKLYLYGNDGIGEEGIRQLVQALTVNTSVMRGGLWLPKRCEEYAKQCPQYHTVSNRITFM